mmetsp:Transcript_25296/g.76936  ORF Transcript_25296/g.76936 Transcript_25296/m.76936 type:complete len:212 (+) Transcript_25296:770-1405(+)
MIRSGRSGPPSSRVPASARAPPNPLLCIGRSPRRRSSGPALVSGPARARPGRGAARTTPRGPTWRARRARPCPYLPDGSPCRARIRTREGTSRRWRGGRRSHSTPRPHGRRRRRRSPHGLRVQLLPVVEVASRFHMRLPDALRVAAAMRPAGAAVPVDAESSLVPVAVLRMHRLEQPVSVRGLGPLYGGSCHFSGMMSIHPQPEGVPRRTR